MRFNSLALLALGVLFVAPALSGATEPPSGFRNLKWGSSPGANLTKYTGPTSDGITMYIPASGKNLSPLFGDPDGDVAIFAKSLSVNNIYLPRHLPKANDRGGKHVQGQV